MAHLFSAALAGLDQFLPSQLPSHAQAATPAGNERKSKRSKSYKPAPHVTPFQKYHKQERASNSWHSGSESQSSSSGSESQSSSSGSSSSSSSATLSDGNADPRPPGFFDPDAPPPLPEHVRLRMEIARMRLRGHRHRGPHAANNPFDNATVRNRLEGQRAHDRASLELLPTQAPAVFASNPLSLAPSTAGLAPAPSSSIVQRWHGLRRELETLREDLEIYAQVCGVTPVAAMRWRKYEKAWAVALDAEDSPPLRFRDVPWPVMHIPHDGSHIHAVEVYRFVLCTAELENVPPYAIARFSEEIERWQTDRFAAEVLPRVLPHERESVAAAGAVLDILLKARRDLLAFHVHARRHTA